MWSPDQAPPLRPGEIIELEIVDIAFGGEGVGRINDLVVFVPFVIPGEKVRVEISEVKKSFARARLQKVLQPSSDRVKAECRYFGECGGCQFQHISYPRQLEIKRKQVSDLFQRIGGFPPQVVLPVIPCPQPYGYRNRIMIRSQWDKLKQGLNIGFIRTDNRLVVDVEECKIASPLLNEKILEVRAKPPPKGGIKVVLREMPEDWVVPPDSFFQNNFVLLPHLISVVKERLKSAQTRFLIDAYCGVGFFSLETAAQMERFVGIELDARAVEAARKNAAQRNLINGEFRQGRTEEVLASCLELLDAAQTTLILDPPRTGIASSLLKMLEQKPLAQIIYVSCHPATLARDLNVLCHHGVFELKQVIPLDMFPQTQHIECVADLRLKHPMTRIE